MKNTLQLCNCWNGLSLVGRSAWAEAGPTLRGMAVAHVELGDFERMEKLLRESLVLDTGNPVAENELTNIAMLRLQAR